MFVIPIDDPNVGLGDVMQNLKHSGITSDSRNGPVIRFPRPCTLWYKNPRRRILDHPIRDANHFFHLFESIWMFAGLNTVKPLNLYNSGMKQYSDDGVTFAAAYGHRWRVRWGDQLRAIVSKLRVNPVDRRIVLQMWDPREIMKNEGQDFACNQQILFSTRPAPEIDGNYYLDIMVTNRSNDLIYGAMGSNLFHFSLLQEYIAHHAGLTIGHYYQTSVNMHLYLENECSKRCWENMTFFTEPSVGSDNSLDRFGLTLDRAPLRLFVDHNELDGDTRGGYLDLVLRPIVEAYRMYKLKTITGIYSDLNKRIDIAQELLAACESESLRNACTAWLQRRRK